MNIRFPRTVFRVFFYRPQRSWGKVIFSQVCVILFTGGWGGGLPQCMLGYRPPWEQTPPPEQTPPKQTPPRADNPQEQTPLPGSRPPEQTPSRPDTPRTDTPWEQTPPRCRACWEIQSTRGQYATFWNAMLFSFFSKSLTTMLKQLISHVLLPQI